jgi:hypothetical protein
MRDGAVVGRCAKAAWRSLESARRSGDAQKANEVGTEPGVEDRMSPSRARAFAANLRIGEVFLES